MAQWIACWAHNPEVDGSRPSTAILLPRISAPAFCHHELLTVTIWGDGQYNRCECGQYYRCERMRAARGGAARRGSVSVVERCDPCVCLPSSSC